MVNKKLKYCNYFSSNPFLIDVFKVDTFSIIMQLSKVALELMYYIFDTKSFLEDKFVFDINEFKQFANKKTDASATQALRELCSFQVIAKTTTFRVYWVNKNIFLDEKGMEFLIKRLKTRRNI
ncbi:hypothetical protein [Cardinium endosymbiont of Dermatophagoides farinae]|uniref:hypothetical protein n=1 Tax=Cardinium endosymbiont of Dermatophagoides farinae TaxID=2597823 RepID=UPI00118227DA|nr:hypothetical protein [Cardinium endosymbiont of Dermatophagoides farinae]TSJ79780.1 hypothetical protein FPG78_06945 [Cardinium endosymbiont of Dermatophagoides farinae]